MTAVVVILGTCAVVLAALVAAVVLVTLDRAGRTEYVEQPEERHLRAVHESGHSVPAKSLGNVVTFTPDRAGRWHVEEGSAS